MATDGLTIAEYLTYLRQVCGTDLLIEPPPACRELWERARRAGSRLGTLFVVRVALTPAASGAYQPDTGDIWVVHDPGDPDRAARTLLHELAHASSPPAVAPTIDAYCDEELATDERARALAHEWGIPHLFAGDDPEAARDNIEELRCLLQAAGELAGSLEPALARRAYSALWTIAGRERWSRGQLHDAMLGLGTDAQAEDRLLDLDRCTLRSRWMLGWGKQRELGRLALAREEASAEILRDALRHVAQTDRAAALQRTERGAAGGAHSFGFLRLAGADDLPAVLATANAALLAQRRHAALAQWEVWGDAALAGSSRLYRLWVEYANGRQRDDDPLPVHLWILALPRRSHDLRAEAALQRYIAGWGAHTSLRVDDWWHGLHELAEHLSTAP